MLALSDTCSAVAMGRGGLCACLSPSTLGWLRTVTGDVRLDAGAVLFHAGDTAEAIYGVRQGAMMLCRWLADRRRQVLSFHFPGDMLGFAADDVHGATAIALGRVSLCRIPRTELDHDEALARQLLGVVRRGVVQTLDMQVRLGRMTAAERVAALLAELYDRLGGGPDLHLPMRIGDMADYLGLRPETVSREFSALRHAGIIGSFSPEGVLPILAPARLRGQR